MAETLFNLFFFTLCGLEIFLYGVIASNYLPRLDGSSRSARLRPDAPPPTPAQPPPPAVAPTFSTEETLCSELAVLAWKGDKAMRGNQTRVLERSLERMLARLNECGFTLEEYKGQRVFPGSRVKILDTAEGPEDVVLEDLEPEVSRHLKILNQALVIVGKKNPL